MKIFRLCALAIASGIAVALLYLVFETALSTSINTVWHDWLNIEHNWWLIWPSTIGLSLLYFGIQHKLDASAENKEHSAKPAATFRALLIILALGFLSLLTGASLGPEAVLVPATVIIGTMIANRASLKKQEAGLIVFGAYAALFVAFFHSLLGGLLGLYLVTTATKSKITWTNFSITAIASLAAYGVLQLVPAHSYFHFETDGFEFSILSLVLVAALVIGGYVANLLLKGAVDAFHGLRHQLSMPWWGSALIAGGGLSLLYWIGGPLIQFTGNESVQPVFAQAAVIGGLGLISLLLLKVMAIAWSHSMGYRGGLVFPIIFVASCATAAIGIYAPGLSPVVGIFAFLFGVLYADRRTHVVVEL